MKVFWTKKSLDKYVTDEVIADRLNFMEATASNAAKNALHYYVAYRTLEWWRDAINKAEKASSKYMSLAEAFLIIQEENKEKS